MWEMAKSTMTLFLGGRLFADPKMMTRQLAIGVVATAFLLIALAEIGEPLWIAALIAGLIGGGTQPYLFKDLRYR